MSEKHARTLSQPSNRARPRDAKEKKVVFKSVLDNPFRIQWPSMPLNLQNAVLAHLAEKLESVSSYRLERVAHRRKLKSIARADAKRAKKANLVVADLANKMDESHDVPDKLILSSTPFSGQKDVNIESPPLLHHLVHGINEVTKRLECQVHSKGREFITTDRTYTEQEKTPLKCVFVCRDDVDPKLLIDHIPHLVAAYNSSKPEDYLNLVILPKGSEATLANLLGVRRAAVIGVDKNYPHYDQLAPLLGQVPVLAAPWLSRPSDANLIPTHIKHLRTTAPTDMKAAKELKAQGRAEAKKRKLSQMLEEPK